MNWYKYHIADYRKDTTHLIPEEHYIYRTLIDWYFLDEAPIPLDNQTITRRLNLKTEWLPYLNQVLNDFFESTSNGWVHHRIEWEIKDYKRKCEHNRVVGKLGGRPKKTKRVSKKNQTLTEVNPNQEPVTSNQEPIKDYTSKSSSSKNDDVFTLFWKAYPKKVGKQEAQKVWKRKKPPIAEVLKALNWQIQSEQWTNGFIPNPATYLNQGRWEDEPPITTNGTKAPKIVWYDTEKATTEKGVEIGCLRLPDENLGDYRNRIQQHLNEGNHV